MVNHLPIADIPDIINAIFIQTRDLTSAKPVEKKHSLYRVVYVNFVILHLIEQPISEVIRVFILERSVTNGRYAL